MSISIDCVKCGGTGWHQYDHNHRAVCDACCPHDKGWWQLKEHYGKDNDKWCCRRGCGTVRPIIDPVIRRMSNEAKPLCRSCRFLDIYNGILAGIAATLERCRQGIPGELDKRQCGAYEREPGSDDE
jgi:hypothetical protein